MIAPLSDPYASVLQFGRPKDQIITVRVGTFTLAGCAILCLSVPGATGAMRFILAGVFAVLAMFTASFALFAEITEIDMGRRAVRSTRGFGGRREIRRDGIIGTDRIIIRHMPHSPHSGDYFPRACLELSSSTAVWPLMTGARMDEAEGYGKLLAARLDLPLEQVDFIEGKPVSEGFSKFGVGMVWAGMIIVAGMIAWPMLRGDSRNSPRGKFLRSRMSQSRMESALQNYRVGRYEQAISDYKYALEGGSEASECWNMIAYSQIELGHKDEALSAARAALKLAPKSGNILDTVGEMHERRGELADAVKFYKRSLAQLENANKGETLTKCGRTLVALSSNTEAISMLEDAIPITGPDTQYGRIARQLLVKLGRKVKESAPPGKRMGTPFLGGSPI